MGTYPVHARPPGLPRHRGNSLSGRTVTVDGKPTETFAANGVQIGVPLETRAHDIRLDYIPRYRPLVRLAFVGWVGVAVTGLVGCDTPHLASPVSRWSVAAQA